MKQEPCKSVMPKPEEADLFSPMYDILSAIAHLKIRTCVFTIIVCLIYKSCRSDFCLVVPSAWQQGTWYQPPITKDWVLILGTSYVTWLLT